MTKTISAILLLSLCAVTMSGCSVMPPEVQEEALPPIPLSVLIKDVNQYKGDTVVLGGYIISVENKADHTRILAVQAPLGVNQRPKNKDLSQGRLVIIDSGFIDPEVYTKDRRITVGGTIMGSSELDPKADYPYLKLQLKTIHLWPVKKPMPEDCWWYDDFFYPYGFPWWRSPCRYHRHRHD